MSNADYINALETANMATRQFRKAQEAYRAHQIGDADFLAAKRLHDAANAEFDAAFELKTAVVK